MYSVGGQAHIDGISFSTNFAESRVSETGKGEYVKSTPQKRRTLLKKLRKIPLLRSFLSFKLLYNIMFWGVYLLGVSSSLLGGNSKAEKAVESVNIIITAILLVFMVLALVKGTKNIRRIKRLWQYHGAEHMAINTYNAGQELTVENIAMAKRSNERCGSMFAVIFLMIYIPLFFVPYGGYFYPLVFAITYEIFDVLPTVKWLRWLLRFGYFIQERLLTAEPDEQQLEVARRGILMAIQRAEEEEAKGDLGKEPALGVASSN